MIIIVKAEVCMSMKITVNKSEFIKSWTLAEHSAGSSSSMNIMSTIRLKAGSDMVELHATDIKTSVICRAAGVIVEEEGEAIIPIKGVSELFKKAGSNEFELEIRDGKAEMRSGRNKYKFTTYSAADFPKIPSSQAAVMFCVVKASDLISAIERGSLCASSGDEYPQFLSSALFELRSGVMSVVSTDKRRLALTKSAVVEGGTADEDLLLPMKGLRDLLRILGMLDPSSDIKILYDDSQAYFSTDTMEFGIRRVDSKFPPYERIIPTSHSTVALIDRSELISAIERVDVVVRDYNRVILVNIQPGGESSFSGRAPEFGEADEHVSIDVTGEKVIAGFNTKFFLDAAKAVSDPTVCLGMNGRDGHMLVKAKDSDSFLCLIAPVDISEAMHEDDGDDESDGEVSEDSSDSDI